MNRLVSLRCTNLPPVGTKYKLAADKSFKENKFYLGREQKLMYIEVLVTWKHKTT